MRKVVITGSNGLLGQTLVNLLLEDKENYEVIGFSQGKNRSERFDFQYVSIDITNKVLLHKKLANHNPNVIINTAAMTNVDACEDDKENCDALNVNAVRYLKEYSEENNTHLIHISSDFNFDNP